MTIQFHNVGLRAVRALVGAVSCALLLVACGSENETAQETQDSIGHVAFAITCSEAVQEEFNRAVALLHHMTYPFSQASFERVIALDPECAVARWGFAMTLFQPLWPTRPGAEEIERGWGAVQEGLAVENISDRERMYLATTEAFFAPLGDGQDYWTRIRRWADATASLYEAYPDDPEAAAFFALSHLATAGMADEPQSHHERAAGVLLGLYEANPSHPGAVHYTIHANDFTGREDLSLPIVHSYGEIAPLNPHALHMPTHIFVRLGDWNSVVDWNIRAAEAALAQRVGPEGAHVWDEYPHAVEYLNYAYLQQGNDVAALDVMDTMLGKEDLQPSFKTAFHVASTRARYALERGQWSEAEAVPVREPSTLDWDRFPWPEAVAWHARGIGAARNGTAPLASESLATLEILEANATAVGETYFATQIAILRLEVAAWIAHGAGDSTEGLQLMDEAVALELVTPKHPVTPGATLPAQEQLGDMRAASGDFAGALKAFQASDAFAPGRLNTLLGAARAAHGAGNAAMAGEYYQAVLDLAQSNSPRPGVVEAREYLGSQP